MSGYQSFGQVIPVLGPVVGFPGNVTRIDGAKAIVARQVKPSTPNALSFGAGAITIPDSVGGTYQSLADFLATPANAANLQKQFSGIAVRNVQNQSQFNSLIATAPAVATTTATASAGASSLTVASATNIQVGQTVEGAGIQAGTTVTSISGTTIGINLVTLLALSTTTVSFTTQLSSSVGAFIPGQMGEVLVRGSIGVIITAGTPQCDLPVYIRTVANASIPGTAVGDFEAADDLSTSSITITTTLGSTTLTTSAGTGLAAGQRVVGPGIPDNTYLVSGATTSWVLSNGAIAAVTGGAASFYNTALLGNPVSPYLVFETGNLDQNNIAEVTLKERHSA